MTLTHVQRRPRRAPLQLDAFPPAASDAQSVANAQHRAEQEREQVFQQTGLRINAQGHSERAQRLADRRRRHV